MDVGKDTTRRNGGGGDQLVELLIVTHREHDMPGVDRLFLLLGTRVACELENLTRDVLEHGSQIDAAADTDGLGVATTLQVAVRATDGEDDVAALGSGLVRLAFDSAYSSGHSSVIF
mgnify:CR=1 FL=1